MKNPWVVTWWDNNLDKTCKTSRSTYEAALLLQAKLKRKGHNNVQINARKS